ncbi:MAG: carbohydrate ABC transporter permease [Lachnospiraceae bacterium]|nr:carbohydrate ABC transporter permease [Lachnospiraceae bacterium]
MKYKTSPSRVVFMIFAVTFLIFILLISVIPLWHVMMGSISNPTATTTSRSLILAPLKNLDFQAYRIIGQYKKLWSGYLNTIIYIIMQCVITGLLVTIGGYIFSRKRFKMRNAFMLFISATMLFNGGMIPMYMIVRNLHMLDTRWAIVLPGAIGVFNIIMMRTSMEGIPDALEEAARLDGAGELIIMFRIILPLCKATFAVIMLFTAVGKWNDYMSALMYLPNRTDLYPLQMTLRSILFNISTATSDMTAQMNMADSVTMYQKSIEYAVIVVSTLPVLCIYPFVQKYFVSGVTLGAVKS